jgi:hypothetical protein
MLLEVGEDLREWFLPRVQFMAEGKWAPALCMPG